MKSITLLMATCLAAVTVMAYFTGKAWADDH